MAEKEQYKRVDIDKLVPYVRNARTHSPEQILQLQASIREFGFVNPVLIDNEYNVIAGHGRIMAARAEGIKEVPCVFVSHLTEAQKRAYILADNRIALNAGWDEEMLRVELEELRDLDFDLDLTGFDDDEITSLFDDTDSTDIEDDGFDLSAASGRGGFCFARRCVDARPAPAHLRRRH